jgi:hypothetical protein
VPAHPKITGDRERRLLALLTIGEPLDAACRAVLVSSTAVRKHARRDAEFAERLAAARQRRAPALVLIDPLDDFAAQLERDALPDPPFDFDATA